MRSNLGTRARLAAHITALVLLILMLVYLDSPKQRGLDWQSLGAIRPAGGVAAPGDPAATLEQLATETQGKPVPEESLRPPETAKSAAPETPAPEAVPEPAPAPAPAPAPEPAAEPAAPEPVPAPVSTPEPEAAAEPEPAPEVAPTPEPTATPEAVPEPVPAVEPVPVAPTPVAEPAPAPASTPEPAPAVEPMPAAAPEPASAPIPEPAPLAQPDESGAIVVAASGAAGTVSTQAATPLPNANLEVLADGVYWLAPGSDLEEELAAVPDLASLILLTPLPGYNAEGFAHVRSTSIPADTTDLTEDAAEHFLHLVRTGPRPIVAAALPGVRAAAFFKGAYLILERGATSAEAFAELETELADAGRDKDEIMHRLAALASRPPQ